MDTPLPVDLLPEIKFSPPEHARFVSCLDMMFGTVGGLEKAASHIGRSPEEVLIHARLFFGNDLGGTWTNLELLIVRLSVMHCARFGLAEMVAQVRAALPYKSLEGIAEKIHLFVSEAQPQVPHPLQTQLSSFSVPALPPLPFVHQSQQPQSLGAASAATAATAATAAGHPSMERLAPMLAAVPTPPVFGAAGAAAPSTASASLGNRFDERFSSAGSLADMMVPSGLCGPSATPSMSESSSHNALHELDVEDEHDAPDAHDEHDGDGHGDDGPDGKHRSRKRAVPWTPAEHRQFLLGLEKLGKGNWCRIAREFVRTRTPAQVASHAQKFFLRQTASPHQRMRASIYDYRTAADVPAQFPVNKRRTRSVGHALHTLSSVETGVLPQAVAAAATLGAAPPDSMEGLRRNATWSHSLSVQGDAEPLPMEQAPHEFPPESMWTDPAVALPLRAYEAAIESAAMKGAVQLQDWRPEDL